MPCDTFYDAATIGARFAMNRLLVRHSARVNP